MRQDKLTLDASMAIQYYRNSGASIGGLGSTQSPVRKLEDMLLMLIRPCVARKALNGTRPPGKQLGNLPSGKADVVNPADRSARQFSLSVAATRPIYLLLRERLGRWDLFLRRAISKLTRKHRPSREETVISLAPLELSTNKYVALFAKAIADQKYTIREFRWRVADLWKTDVVVFHWPDEFFATDGNSTTIKSVIKLTGIWLSKHLFRTRFIWVAHNAAPHDATKLVPHLTRWFLRSTDGIIFLSAYSRDLISGLYPESRERDSLVTVHGHYRDSALTPLTGRPNPNGDVKLVYIGLVRRYKNLEVLVDAATRVPGLQLLVSGMAMDRSLGDALLARAASAENIRLDLWDTPIGDAKFEAIVDSGDAVVLPYRNILNSGAALFALSRNRPVLAPNIGSLPELLEKVGSDWIYLYDGEFDEKVLVDFMAWMRRTKLGRTAPLEHYAWDRIGRELGEFIDSVRSE
jgi:beta-1,4-mannosyltransferase